MPARRKGANLGRRTHATINVRNNRVQRTDDNVTVPARRLERRQRRGFVLNSHVANDRQQPEELQVFRCNSFLRLAFQYEPNIEYYAHPKVTIDIMDKECLYCHALKFKNESNGMCCALGKVQLPEIETPPEPLNGLLIGTDPDSKLFLNSILFTHYTHYSIRRYHASSHGLKQKNGSLANEEHQLIPALAYLNQILWGEYIQSIQDRLSASICDYCWLMSPAHCHFKIYAM